MNAKDEKIYKRLLKQIEIDRHSIKKWHLDVLKLTKKDKIGLFDVIDEIIKLKKK